jgi:nucleotide-binding universal stress UspA family protein
MVIRNAKIRDDLTRVGRAEAFRDNERRNRSAQPSRSRSCWCRARHGPARGRVSYQAIIDITGSKDCDLLTMTSHGRHGISALVLGSEMVKVLSQSKKLVLVHR